MQTKCKINLKKKIEKKEKNQIQQKKLKNLIKKNIKKNHILNL